MSSTHVPPPRSPRPPMRLPCASCGEMMHVTSILPHERFINLDVRKFACACGSTTSDVVAHT